MGEFELPRTLAGRFRLESVLGQGGMGTVYRAVDTTMQRTVAIKLIDTDPGAEDDAVSRFLREARNTARITHPHIVHLYDLGRGDRGELFFVMELLAGESLSDRIRRLTRLPVDDAIHIATQICAALGYAHKKGLVHRDLKPANVQIMERGGDPLFVKVLDFGVAKAHDQGTQITKTGALVGTVDYMAPEQILSKKIDARTDVYSLGVILYRMFTGTALFPEGAMPVVIKNHIGSAPEPMASRAPDVALSPGLERVVMQCLAKKPEHRYATMEELEHALVRAAREPRAPSRGASSDFDDLSSMKTVRRDSMPDDMAERLIRTEGAKPEAPYMAPRAPESETKLAIPRGRESIPSYPGAGSGASQVAGAPPPRSGPQASTGSALPQASTGSAMPRHTGLGTGSVSIEVEALGETPPSGIDRVSEGGSGSAPGIPISRTASVAPASMQAPPSGSPWRWLGFLAPLPAAVYVALVGPTPPALLLLGGGLVVGGGLFFWGILGRSQS